MVMYTTANLFLFCFAEPGSEPEKPKAKISKLVKSEEAKTKKSETAK